MAGPSRGFKWNAKNVPEFPALGTKNRESLEGYYGSAQNSQTIIDLFDGVIDVYQKELQARPRRFLIVKKMYGKNTWKSS